MRAKGWEQLCQCEWGKKEPSFREMLIPNGNYSLPGPGTLPAVISCPGVCAGEQLRLHKATGPWGSRLARYPPLCAIPAHCLAVGEHWGTVGHFPCLANAAFAGHSRVEEGKDWVLPLGKSISPSLGRRALATPWPEHLSSCVPSSPAERVVCVFARAFS